MGRVGRRDRAGGQARVCGEGHPCGARTLRAESSLPRRLDLLWHPDEHLASRGQRHPGGRSRRARPQVGAAAGCAVCPFARRRASASHRPRTSDHWRQLSPRGATAQAAAGPAAGAAKGGAGAAAASTLGARRCFGLAARGGAAVAPAWRLCWGGSQGSRQGAGLDGRGGDLRRDGRAGVKGRGRNGCGECPGGARRREAVQARAGARRVDAGLAPIPGTQ